jgi:hypothetical protein
MILTDGRAEVEMEKCDATYCEILTFSCFRGSSLFSVECQMEIGPCHCFDQS